MPPINRRTFLKNAGATTALYNPETMIRAATNPAGAAPNLQPMGVIEGIIDDLHHNPFQSGLPLSTGSWLGELDAGGGDEIGFWDSWEAAKNELTPREISDIKSGKRESQLYKALNQIVSGMRNGTPEGVQFRYFLLHQAEWRKSPVDHDLQKRIQDAAIEHYNKVGSQSHSGMYVEDPVVWLELEHDGRWELNSQYKVLHESFERIPGLNNALEHLSSQPLNVLKGFIKDGGIREMAKVFSQIPVSAAATVDGFSEFKKTDSYKNNMPEKSRPQDLSQEALQKFSSPARPQSILPMDIGFPVDLGPAIDEMHHWPPRQTGPRINPMGAVGPSDLTSNLPMDPEQLIRNQQAAEMGKQLFGYQIEPGIGMPGKIIFWDKRYTANTPKENPDIIFVFGDNLQGRGKGGQAVLRDNPNVLGVPTKRYPGRSQGDYFTGSPDEARAVTNSIDEIDRLVKAGKTVAIPVDGGQISLGTGLAELNTRAPELLSYIQGSINQIAGAGAVGPGVSAEVHSSKSPQESQIRNLIWRTALGPREFYGGYPNKLALIEGIKRAYDQGIDVSELLPLIPAGPLSQEDLNDLLESRWEVNPKTGELTPKAIDPSKELAIEAVGAPGTPTKYGNQLPFSSYGITTGQPVGPGKSSEILSASQLKRIGGMETLEQQLEALRDIVYDRGIQAHNEIKQNALNYMENTAGTPAGTKTIAGKIRDAQAGGKFPGATSEDLIDQMATGIADQAITGVSQRAGKYEPSVVEGTTTFEDPDKVLMRALVNSDIPFEQDPDASSASEGYKVDTEAAFIENMGDKKRFDPTVNTRPIEQLSPGERLAATLQGATGIPPLSESEIMKLAAEINRVKASTVQSFADQPELLLAQGRQQQMVWNPKTEKYETTIDYTGKKKSAHSPLDYLNMWSEGARGKLDLPYDPRDGGIRRLINIVRQPPASPQAMPPMDIGLGSNAEAVLGEQTGPRINPMFRYTPEDFGGNVPPTPVDPSFDAANMQQTFDVNQDKSFDLTGTSPTDSPVMQALPVTGPPSPMEALPVTNNAKLKQKLKDPVGTMKGAGQWAIDKAKNNIITRTGGKVNNFFDLPADNPLRMKIDEMAGDSKLKKGLGRSVRFGASLPGSAGRMGMPKAIGLDSLADIVELSKGAYKINQYEKFGTPKDLVIGRDVQNYDELIAHLVGRNTDAHDGNGVAYITPDQAERLIGLKNELTSAYQRGEIKEAEEHPNYKTMRKLINEFTKNREDGPQGAFNRSINVLEPSSSDEMGWMSQWRKEVQAGQDNFIDEPEAQLTPYGMFHVPIWSDVTGRAGSVEGAAGLGGGALDHITNPYAFIPRVAEGVLGDNSASYASLGDGFVRSPNYETIRLRSDVDTKSLLGKPDEDKQKIIYDGTPYTNTRYWKWNPDSRTLVNRHTGTSVREEDTGIQNFGEKMRNWNEYTRRMRDAQSRGEGEGTFSGEGVQSKVDAIESDFKGRAMFDKYDHGHTARHAHEDFGISDIWEEGSVFEDLPWYSKIGVALDRAVDASEKMHSDAWEGVKGWLGTGQSDETEDPRRMDNIIRIYRETGDNPAHIVGYNRDMANPGWSENPYGRFATEQERLLRNLIPYWEHKESKYSDIYKLIGEGE